MADSNKKYITQQEFVSSAITENEILSLLEGDSNVHTEGFSTLE